MQKRFVSDLGTIIILHDIVEFFFKSYNFGWILRDVKKNLVQELNFINEGKNVERCAKDLKTLKFVHIPKVYWTHTKTVKHRKHNFYLNILIFSFIEEGINIGMDRWHKN